MFDPPKSGTFFGAIFRFAIGAWRTCFSHCSCLQHNKHNIHIHRAGSWRFKKYQVPFHHSAKTVENFPYIFWRKVSTAISETFPFRCAKRHCLRSSASDHDWINCPESFLSSFPTGILPIIKTQILRMVDHVGACKERYHPTPPHPHWGRWTPVRYCSVHVTTGRSWCWAMLQLRNFEKVTS